MFNLHKINREANKTNIIKSVLTPGNVCCRYPIHNIHREIHSYSTTYSEEVKIIMTSTERLFRF